MPLPEEPGVPGSAGARPASRRSFASTAGVVLATLVLACVGRSPAGPSGGPLDLREPPDALARFSAACEGGSAAGCHGLGEQLAARGDAERARTTFGRACEAGFPSSCTALGRMLALGEGGEIDLVAAVPLYEKACEIGDPDGCFELGQLFRVGEGVKQNTGMADEFFARSAVFLEQGCLGGSGPACFHAALLHQNGWGVEVDAARSERLFDRGCQLGHAAACREIRDRTPDPDR